MGNCGGGCGGKKQSTPIKVGTPRPQTVRQVSKVIPAKLVKIQWGNK